MFHASHHFQSKLSALSRHRSDGQKTCSPTAVASEMRKKWHSRSRGVANQKQFATPLERERHFLRNSAPTAVAAALLRGAKTRIPAAVRSKVLKKWHSHSRGAASQKKFATPPERERHFFSNSSPTAVAMCFFETFKKWPTRLRDAILGY